MGLLQSWWRKPTVLIRATYGGLLVLVESAVLGASLGLTAVLGIITILSIVKPARVRGTQSSSEAQGG